MKLVDDNILHDNILVEPYIYIYIIFVIKFNLKLKLYK
jgi:hypothetical protein